VLVPTVIVPAALAALEAATAPEPPQAEISWS
jgi:hypothetical protein